MSSIARRRKLNAACRLKSSSKICRSTRCRSSVRRSERPFGRHQLRWRPLPFECLPACHFDRKEKSFSRAFQSAMPAVKHYYVYLITNWNNKVMYVGITNDLQRRIYEHNNKLVKGFTDKYNVNKLVYFEKN